MGFIDKIKKALKSDEEVPVVGDVGEDVVLESGDEVPVVGDVGEDVVLESDGEVPVVGDVGEDVVLESGDEVPVVEDVATDVVLESGDEVPVVEDVATDVVLESDEETPIIEDMPKENIKTNAPTLSNQINDEELKNFRYVDELIHNNSKEIVLDSDIILSDDEKSKYLTGVKLDVDGLIINGNGHTIDAKGKTRIFYCTGKNITIKNIILKNGYSKRGGAINNNYGELTVSESTITGNASDMNGGAIYNDQGKLTVSESTISGNASNVNGGAIYNDQGELTVSESTISGNASDMDGGAIYNDQGELTVSESTISGNASDMDGGAINNSGLLNITESLISQNTAHENGGAINNIGHLNIKESTITYNISHENGGAINNLGELNIEKSLLNHNAANNGGAIKNDAEGILDIRNSTINSNSARKGDGGAINNNGILRVIGTTITQNIAKRYGGAIQTNKENFKRISCDIKNNKPNDIDSIKINGFHYFDNLIHSGTKRITLDSDIILDAGEEEKYSNGINLDVNDLVLDGNGHIIDAQGKIQIFYCTGKNITLKNIALKKGYADNGGVIHNYDGELTIIESKITENVSGSQGIIYNKEGFFKFIDCEFLKNESSINLILNKDFLEIQGTNFKDNQSKNILNNSHDSNLSINYVNFIQNTVESSIVYNLGYCTVEKGNFENNIHSKSSNSIINLTDLTLISPKINDDSKGILNEGYIYIKESDSSFESKIYGNGKTENAISLIKEKKFDFGYLDKKIHESGENVITLEEDICFENYEIYFYEGGIELDIDNLVIDGNGKTIDGFNKSRIFLITGNNITLKNITFKNGRSYKNYNNPLNNNGGAIKINPGTNTKIINCNFIDNNSDENGGAINNAGELDMSDSTFKNNKTKNGAGGAVNNAGKLDISDSAFNDNKTRKDAGGAINNDDDLKIIKSVFEGNHASKDGGAINNAGELNIIKSELLSNLSDEKGGAIANVNGNLTLSESTFENNLSYCGSIYDDENKFKTNKCNFNNNFEYLDNLIHRYKKIVLDMDIILSDDEKLRYSDGIKLDQNNLVIDGNGYTIDAKGKSRIFYCCGIDITIRNITLKNGFAYYGGAIENKGGLTITDSTFIENTSEGSMGAGGGAIYNRGDLTITDSAFTRNNAIKGYGGAIKNDTNYNSILKRRGKLIVDNSTFDHNKAYYIGGAIESFSREEMTISNCTFTNNTEGYYME